ncbi:MAG TPA: PTS sugar transporter subunit IIA [Chthoniobacterales bacterium]|jgi:mannitol/fructose-specific phosphotransferase system IIA component (Ntr-type)
MAVDLNDLLDERHVTLQLRARKPPNALRELVQLLAATGKIDNPEKFLERVLAREANIPSSVQYGVAFPHARTDLIDQIVIGIGRSRAGIPFADGRRAQLIFLIGVPQQLINDYLICVGTLARIVADEVTRTALFQAETPRQFIDAIKASL